MPAPLSPSQSPGSSHPPKDKLHDNPIFRAPLVLKLLESYYVMPAAPPNPPYGRGELFFFWPPPLSTYGTV